MTSSGLRSRHDSQPTMTRLERDDLIYTIVASAVVIAFIVVMVYLL